MSEIVFEDSVTHATDLSASFYTHFQAVKNDISARLEAPDASKSNRGLDSEEIISISSEIVKLRKDLVDATPYLPTYDRGKCEQQLKALEESLSRHRAPKSKFAFKRKPATTPAPSSQLTPDTPSSQPLPSPKPTAAPSTTNLTLTSHTSAHLTISSLGPPSQKPNTPAEIQRSSDVTLSELRNCVVNLCPSPLSDASSEGRSTLTITALHAKLLHRVVLIVPPIEGSVLLHDVQDSVVIVACHQFRMHDSKNTTVLLHVLSNPVIEGSNSIQFGPYPDALRSPSAKKFFERPSKHALAQDFDWIKPSASPNWSVLASSMNIDWSSIVDNGLEGEKLQAVLKAILPRG